MSKNVFCDYHHGGLYYSFYLLFEKRLGWKLHRPIGGAWYTRGFWTYSSHPSTIKQYLEIPENVDKDDGVYLVPATEGNDTYIQRAITFEKFLETDFDFIIASVYNHERPYYNLVQMFKKDAVLIRELGNISDVCDFSIYRNILNSALIPVPQDVNCVIYHPEFSLKDYRYVPPQTHNMIRNFVNCMPQTKDAPMWNEYRSVMSDFVWKMHGILGEDGNIHSSMMPRAMRNTSFVWHVKYGGDGYGFTLHNAYASGRPCIVKKSYYVGQTAEALLDDSITCVDLDAGTKSENIEKIRYFSKPETHLKMCENAYTRFNKVVNFDKEFEAIKQFLELAKKKKGIMA